LGAKARNAEQISLRQAAASAYKSRRAALHGEQLRTIDFAENLGRGAHEEWRADDRRAMLAAIGQQAFLIWQAE
jgi:hypothetical protein